MHLVVGTHSCHYALIIKGVDGEGGRQGANKRAALCWMVLSFLSVFGAAPIQADGEYSITLVPCRWWIDFGESGGELLAAVFLASDLLISYGSCMLTISLGCRCLWCVLFRYYEAVL